MKPVGRYSRFSCCLCVSFKVVLPSAPLLQNSEVRSQFQEFLSLSGHRLEQRPFPDVVQLALSQPHSSEVYKQARQQALNRAKSGKLYFELM